MDGRIQAEEEEPVAPEEHVDRDDSTSMATVHAVGAKGLSKANAITLDDERDRALAEALKVLCYRLMRKPHRDLLRNKTTEEVTLFQIFHLLRRLAAYTAALVYVVISMQASYATVHVLRGMDNPDMSGDLYTSDIIGSYAGLGSVRDSPLMMNVFANDTTPRTTTVYLESSTTVSYTGCSHKNFNPSVYNDTFTRFGMYALMRYTTYNITFLAQSELVAPIVDCSQTSIVSGDSSSTRVVYLMRNKVDTQSVYFLHVLFSAQDYYMDERSERGPGLLLTLTAIHDMRQTDLKNYIVMAIGYPFTRVPSFQAYEFVDLTSDTFWRLRSIPYNRSTEAVKEVLTACRTGFFIDSETDQANIMNLHWTLESDPYRALTYWEWRGKPILRDSWAWVHGIHFWFGVDTIFALVVLNVTILRNFRQGKIWIGNAFASISNALLLRGALVFVSWHINEYWTLKEFCLARANRMSGIQFTYFHPELMHADLLNIYMCIVTVLGYMFRERIDPALVMVLFEVGFTFQLEIISWVPALEAKLTEFSAADFKLGFVAVNEVLATISPMRLWTVHPLTANAKGFIVTSLFPISITLVIVLAYILCRKIYRYFYPEKVYAQTMTESSVNERTIRAQVLSLTMFEIATGAALRAKFGVLSDYENYIFIRGTKYASSDGIYCNGYVIANGKFLVATSDLPSIAAMKITRLRFTNVYVYDVISNDVKQTARLVYPNTLSWRDLANVNVYILK
ncbi:hypothetical protein PybrP1_011052 [[Pythium] brassicae (nom. inval.)]|nr:hypothetical protein PybrP1_011052 [[Pythium] brassicae (nom. inval.)]